MHRKHHVLVLFGLLGLGTLVQAVVIGRAVVPSLDAVRFVKTAQAIGEKGLASVIQTTAEQPLFPAWLAMVHEGLAWFAGESPSLWATSAQVAAAVPLVLTLVPLYLLLLRLFDFRIAVVGSILFCLLPETRRLGADGLSDSIHLLFLTGALWAVVAYWTSTARTRVAWIALAGLLTGLALLARAEAIILPVALLLCLAISYFRMRFMQRATSGLSSSEILEVGATAGLSSSACLKKHCWASQQWHLAVYILGLMFVLTPYVLLAGSFTPRTAMARVLGRPAAVASLEPTSPIGETFWQMSDGHPLRFPVKEGSLRRHGISAALLQYAKEMADVFGYWLFVPAVWALWRHRRELTRTADQFLMTFFVVFSIVVIYFASIEGYLSARHLLPLLVVGLGVASLGLWEASTIIYHGTQPFEIEKKLVCHKGSTLGVCTIMAVVVIAYLVSATHPMRAHRLNHRRAGAWLAQQTSETHPAVLDTRGWTMLYSARPTYQYDEAKVALCDHRLGYVVVERKELQYNSDRARTLRYLLREAGQRVARFDEPGTRSTNAVEIYRWNARRFRSAARLGRVANVVTQKNESGARAKRQR